MSTNLSMIFHRTKVLWWYSRESFFYRILNKALRVQNIDVLVLFRSYIYDMHRQLQKYQSKCEMTVYRSQLISTDELDSLKQYIGQFISVNSFFSTTFEREIALFYMGAGTPPDGLQRALFEIHADPQMVTTKPFADISSMSHFGNESEVLFMLGSIFQLNEINLDDNQVWIIRMTLWDDEKHDLRQVLMHMQEQIGSEEMNLRTFAKLLWKMGKFDLAEKYYCHFLNEILPDDPSLPDMYEELVQITSQKGDYDKSVEWQKKKLEIENSTGKFITRQATAIENL